MLAVIVRSAFTHDIYTFGIQDRLLSRDDANTQSTGNTKWTHNPATRVDTKAGRVFLRAANP